MRIFGSCLMIAETAENLGDLTIVILNTTVILSVAKNLSASYSGLKKRVSQAKATA